MHNNIFQVVITNHLKADQDKSLVTKKLAALFKIDEQKAAQFLVKPRTIVKDKVDELTAGKYLAAIQQTGAHCEIVNSLNTEDLPQIVEPTAIEPSITKPRTTSPAAARLKSEPELSLIAREQKSQKETREKLSTLEHAGNETLCPDCGTIRGSVDAICLHCGYNPFEDESNHGFFTKKNIIIIGISLVIIIAVALIAGLPYYQKFMVQKKFSQDLIMAFDIRNQVSDFIDKTGFFPNQNMDANLSENISNDSIESIFLSENSVITVSLRASAINEPESQSLILVPKSINGKIAWNCLGGTLRADLRPDVCKQAQQNQ